MRTKRILLFTAAMGALCALALSRSGLAQPPQDAVVRLAELEIDAAQLDKYKELLKEEIEASIRLEPGVLSLYAVAVKGHPNQIRLFEIYRDQASYLSHLQSPHFLKYKTETQDMVKQLTLLETEPVVLGSKLLLGSKFKPGS